MAEKGQKIRQFSGKDQLLAEALARGLGLTRAAEAAGVSIKTVQRRKADPAFRALVDALVHDLHETAGSSLAATMSLAARKLRKLVRSENEQVALAASRAVMEWGLKVREQLTLAARVAAMEKALGLRDEGPGAEEEEGDGDRPEGMADQCAAPGDAP